MIARRGVRGLRVEQVAAEAGVAVSLIYYYFDNRNGLVRATLEHANERAATRAATAARRPAARRPPRACSPSSTTATACATRRSCGARCLPRRCSSPSCATSCARRARPGSDARGGRDREGVEDGSVAGDVDPHACAERLTALVDGLSARWLAGLVTRERARELLAAAIAAELGSAILRP